MRFSFFITIISVLFLSCNNDAASTKTAHRKTNILLITAQELGYSDLGCLGSEIATPNLDKLAAEGRILAGLRTAPTPTQGAKMLLAGHYDIANAAPTLPKLLADSNYYNILVGANLDATQAAQFTATHDIKDAPFAIKTMGEKLSELFHKKPTNRPFFAWAAFPLSGEVKMDAQKFGENRYNEITPDALQKKRFQALVANKVIDPFTELSEQNEFVAEKMMDKPRMETYAQRIEEWDKQIGVLLALLKEKNELANTTVFVLAPSGISDGQTTTNRLAVNWQTAVAAHLGVGLTLEGNLATPLIISGKGIKNKSNIPASILTLPDVTETILAAAELPPLDTVGRSIFPILTGKKEAIHGDKEYILVEKAGHIALRQGEWKLVSFGKTANKNDFKLYNLLGDPGERNDLSTAYPARKKRMMKYYHQQKE